jgi:hypothetical protein
MRVMHVLIAVLALSSAFLLGRVLPAPWQDAGPLALVPDHRPAASAVVVESWSNGQLRGVLRGSGMLIIGSRSVVPDQSGAFVVTIATARPPIVASSGAAAQQRYVASKRGKKYYRVGSKSGEQLSFKNRIYFATKEEAEAAGFTAGK